MRTRSFFPSPFLHPSLPLPPLSLPPSSGPDRIIRASRHYERAGHILTRLGVATALEFKRSRETEVPSIGQVVMVTAPARIDIAGAWSDTPPQTYEWGGVVLTVAINVEGQVHACVRATPL